LYQTRRDAVSRDPMLWPRARATVLPNMRCS
jgi:hypothetical protein